ncbi:DUF6468 domain-containing protein [Maricaulis sp. D1M11]|uniref:DUF6468 domain-containing protein n=1 Tax=Maricaulis sp. D1M11 TaxID=3076117 RepID=UPI0039B54980
MTMAGLMFEGAVAALLIVAAFLCWRVDARLRALKNGQDGVRESVVALNEATDRARASLLALERATTQSSEILEKRITEARSLSDELSLVSDRANRKGESLSTRRTGRRRASEIFPQGSGSNVMNDLKDIR